MMKGSIFVMIEQLERMKVNFHGWGLPRHPARKARFAFGDLIHDAGMAAANDRVRNRSKRVENAYQAMGIKPIA